MVNLPEKDKYPCVHACPVVKRLQKEHGKLQKKIEAIKICGSYAKYLKTIDKINKGEKDG